MKLTQLADVLKEENIFLPLPWQGYTGAFCCRSCVGAELGCEEYSEYDGFVWICEQQIEDVKQGDVINTFLCHAVIDASHEERLEFAARVVKLLDKHGAGNVKWDGDMAHTITLDVEIDHETVEWAYTNLSEDDEYGGYDGEDDYF